jgi:hypothetical protein
MDELVGRIVANVGVTRPVAETAVGIILDFLSREVPPEMVAPLLARVPGVDALITVAHDSAGGMPIGIGGLMGVGTRLMGAGLGMDQIQGVTREIIEFAREKAGQETVDGFAAAIPALRQFL